MQLIETFIAGEVAKEAPTERPDRSVNEKAHRGTVRWSLTPSKGCAVPVKCSEISRVVIRGEWITVQRGTFVVEPFTMTDTAGNPAHPDLGLWAYHFKTDLADEYYGPLGEIQLFKMANI